MSEFRFTLGNWGTVTYYGSTIHDREPKYHRSHSAIEGRGGLTYFVLSTRFTPTRETSMARTNERVRSSTGTCELGVTNMDLAKKARGTVGIQKPNWAHTVANPRTLHRRKYMRFVHAELYT